MRLFSLPHPKLTIRRKLKQDGFSPIKGNSRHWDELAVEYIKQHYRPKWIRASSRHSEQEIAYRLRKKAMEVYDEEYNVDADNLYLLASRWCAAPTTIKDRAERMGFSFLNMDEDSDDDNEIWEMRVMDYRAFDSEIDMSGELMCAARVEKKVSIMKGIARDLICRKNYEENSELMWNTAIRWFTKKRP